MTSVKLVASGYTTSSSSVSVSNPDRMYADTGSTTYATLTHSNKSTTAYYVYLSGFDFTGIPSGATVTSFTVRVKGYESSLSTSSSYAPCLVNGTSAISGTTASSNFGSSASTITVPTGSLTWGGLSDYGSNLGIRLSIMRSNKNKQGTLYIYGAEIEVTYMLPGEGPFLYVKSNGSWVQVQRAYVKSNGSWSQVSLNQAFTSGVNYVAG